MSALGVDYTGSIAVGENNETCEYWNNTTLSAFYLSTISNINNIVYSLNTTHSNQCRNADNNGNGPWCFDKQGHVAPCNIPRCGKRFRKLYQIFIDKYYIFLITS